MRRRRALLWGLVALLALVGGGWLALLRLQGDRAVDEADVMPPGFWVRTQAPDAAPEDADSDAAARLLSLPYASTGRRAPAEHGVIFHDPERTWGAYNLYSSGHGPEAILVDMEGRFVHRWRYPYELAFPEHADELDLPYWRRVRLRGDGSLVVLFQGGGLIALDAGSNLLWRVDRGTYNDLQVAEDGTLLTLTKDARSLPEISPEPVLDDQVLFLSPNGKTLGEVSILRSLLRSPFAHLFEDGRETVDVLHANTIELVERDDLPDPFRRGRILVSARSVDLLALLDPAAETVVWARRGPWVMQHEPRLLDDGHLLLFDNRGGPEGRSRVVEVDPASGEIVWSFHHPSFHSPQAGVSRRLPNGNTLITSSEGGRAFEVTRSGEVVWEFVSPHRGGHDDELVAALWEVIRLSAEEVEWLE